MYCSSIYFPICVIAISCFLGMCSKSNEILLSSNQLIEYQIPGGGYGIVVPIDGISFSQAKKIARERAAQITVAEGKRYFTVDSEKVTTVMKSEGGDRGYSGNLYQEIIIDRGFNQTDRQGMDLQETKTYRALRFTFTIYDRRPLIGGVDSCKYTKCPNTKYHK